MENSNSEISSQNSTPETKSQTQDDAQANKTSDLTITTMTPFAMPGNQVIRGVNDLLPMTQVIDLLTSESSHFSFLTSWPESSQVTLDNLQVKSSDF